jgi:hypothetical protein
LGYTQSQKIDVAKIKMRRLVLEYSHARSDQSAAGTLRDGKYAESAGMVVRRQGNNNAGEIGCRGWETEV